MIILSPIPITAGKLTASNVPETDYAAYVAGTTYALAARVIVVADHAIYESLQAGNVGHTPLTSPLFWIEVSATQRYQMFDQSIGTLTTLTSPLAVTVTPGQLFDTVAVLETSVSSVRVKVTDTEYGIVYDKTQSLTSSDGVTDWYSYFFLPVVRRTTAVFTGIPAFANAAIEITFTDTGPVSCGVCLIGPTMDVGTTLEGASVGIQDYSKKTQDEWGNYSIVQRAFRKRGRFPLMVPSNKIDAIQKLLASLRAIPALYIGSDQYDSTSIYGFFKEFDINIKYPYYSEYTLDIEGLV
jgi:hypothetical protein